MAINRNYNHNVDVKSSQVGGCLKTFAKLALGAGILTVGGIAIIVAILVSQESKNEKEALSRTKPLVLDSVLVDFKRNPVRYSENWEREYVTYSGRIDKLQSYEFSFERVNTTRGSTTVVVCDFEYSEREKIALMDIGDYVSVLGKLSIKEPGYGRAQFVATLRDCTIR